MRTRKHIDIIFYRDWLAIDELGLYFAICHTNFIYAMDVNWKHIHFSIYCPYLLAIHSNISFDMKGLSAHHKCHYFLYIWATLKKKTNQSSHNKQHSMSIKYIQGDSRAMRNYFFSNLVMIIIVKDEELKSSPVSEKNLNCA